MTFNKDFKLYDIPHNHIDSYTGFWVKNLPYVFKDGLKITSSKRYYFYDNFKKEGLYSYRINFKK